MRDDTSKFREVEIVGVVGDVKHLGLEAETPREIYVPIPQVPDATSVWLANNMYWVAKTNGTPLSYANAIRREITAVNPDVASSFVRSMDQWLAQSVDTRRFNLRVVAVFAVTALLLAAIGVYGVAAEAVAVRNREIGVRAALGATDRQLTTVILKGGLGPVIGGAVLGTGAALVLTNALSSFVYRRDDPRSDDVSGRLRARRGCRGSGAVCARPASHADRSCARPEDGVAVTRSGSRLRSSVAVRERLYHAAPWQGMP